MGVVAGCTAVQQHNGTNTASQQVALNTIDMTQTLGVGKTAHHNGKWFVAAAFATAQFAHRLFVGGVACQVESAQALDGDDAAAGQQLNAALDDSVAGLACGTDGRCRGRIPARIAVHSLAPRNMRPALKAGIGLRMKAPVERVSILCGAGGAHRKVIHRRGRSVIGQRADDGKARPAVGAVDKRIVIAPIGGVEQLTQAIVTGGDIGRNERGVSGLILRCHNAKALLVGGIPAAGR